jgi:hypothetical protein
METTINQEYISKYAQRFTEQLCKQFFFNKAFITGKEIIGFSPVKQVNMFILKNLFLNWQKEAQKLKSPFFNYEEPEVKQALKAFMNTLSNHIHVYQYDFVPLVQGAVKDTIMLAVAPLEFFKKECETISAPQLTITALNDYLKYLKHNRCIFEKVILDMEQRGLNEMFAGEGVRLIHRIVSENTDKLEKPEQIIEALSAVIPCTVGDFFNTKKPIMAPEPKLSPEIKNTPETTVDVPDLAAPIESHQGPKIQSEPSASPAEKTEDWKIVSTDVNTSTTKIKDRATALAQVASTKQPLSISTDKPTLNDTLKSKKENISLSEKIGKAKIESIQKSIPFHLKFVFINMLFNGDQNLWQEAINKVDAASSYNEAVNVLQNHYAQVLKWDPKDEHVESLYELIEKKFK